VVGDAKMTALDNSDVIKNVLKNLIDISGRKTSRGQAIDTIDTVMRKLENRYIFLKDIKIIDNRYIENEEVIDITRDIDKVRSSDMGKALNDIILTTHYSLGENAGHFFIKELQRNMGGDYNSVMKEMGVDLGLMQLEKEVKDLGKAISQKK